MDELNLHALRDSVSASGDIGVDWGPQGLQITDARPKPVWARITGGSGPYSWQQVNESVTTLPDLGSGFGMSGTTSAGSWPAYEVTGNTGVAGGTKVQLWPSPSGQFWLFSSPASAASLPYDEAYLSSDYNVASTTPTDIGVSLVLPSAGDYQIGFTAGAQTEADAAENFLTVWVYDNTAASFLDGLYAHFAHTIPKGAQFLGYDTASMTRVVKGVASSRTIKLQAYSTSATWTQRRIFQDTTRLWYRQLA